MSPDFAINHILYQRGIYDCESFEKVKKFGQTILVTTDARLKKYLNVIVIQLREFLLKRNIDKLVMEIMNVETKEAVEKWDFCIECDRSIADEKEVSVDMRQVHEHIRGVMRQISASVAFLPCLEGVFSFDILLYTDKNTALPSVEWADTKPNMILNEEKVKLKGFVTGIQNVETVVSYKAHD